MQKVYNDNEEQKNNLVNQKYKVGHDYETVDVEF